VTARQITIMWSMGTTLKVGVVRRPQAHPDGGLHGAEEGRLGLGPILPAA
jgi:hypothetical protein